VGQHRSAQDRDTALSNLEALAAHAQSAAKAVEQAQAALRAAEARLGFTRIFAPASGRLSTLVARRGEFVGTGSPILTLVDFQQSWVYVELPETQAGFATQRDVGGENRDIRAIRVKVLIENPGGRYLPGMTAELVVRKRQ